MSSPIELYYITDRSQLGPRPLKASIARAIAAGVDWIQIREKDMSVRQLLSLAEAAIEQASQGTARHTRVIVNDRLDVALAANASGVHLGAHSMSAAVVRRIVPSEFRIGVSCHSLEDARAAELAGADYILLGPVFATPSKARYGPPLGVEKLRDVTQRVKLPVFALGGITAERARECIDSGAAGIAGIRIFQDCEAIDDLVRELRGLS